MSQFNVTVHLHEDKTITVVLHHIPLEEFDDALIKVASKEGRETLMQHLLLEAEKKRLNGHNQTSPIIKPGPAGLL